MVIFARLEYFTQPTFPICFKFYPQLMMKRIIPLMMFLVLLVFLSCQNTDKQVDTNNDKDSLANHKPTNSVQTEQLCFELRFKQDLSELKLNIQGEEVTGILNILPYEKDASKGTLKGKKKENTIRAEWTYVIEGNTQTEEVEFKLEGDKIFQRLGELEEKNGKFLLKETSKIEYSDPMLKVECKQK